MSIVISNGIFSEHSDDVINSYMENRLKEIRLKKGLTREALAELSNTTKGHIYKLETGRARLSDVWLSKLAPILGVPQGALLSDGDSYADPNTVVPVHEIPIIDYVQAGAFADVANPFPRGEGMETAFVEHKHNKLFGLKVRGSSMDRVFKEGTVVVVDYTDTDLVDRKYYVISNGDGCSVKLYRANPIRFEPESFSVDYDPIYPDQNTRVIGRIVKFFGDI